MKKIILGMMVFAILSFIGCSNPMHSGDDNNSGAVNISARAAVLGFSNVADYTAYVHENCLNGDHSNCDIATNGTHSVCKHTDHQGTCHDGSVYSGSSHDNHNGDHH
jgi:hypothetical protein